MPVPGLAHGIVWKMYRRAEFVAIVLACVALSACTSGRVELLVDLRTDFVAGHEFATVESTLRRADGEDEGHRSRTVAAADPVIEGLRIAEFTDLKKGRYSLLVELRDSGGALLLERPVELELRESFAVTVLITRDCRDVTCMDPGWRACLQGECVRETCTPEASESCPAPACMRDADCTPPVAACAQAQCLAGACLLGPTGPGVCGPGLYCDPEFGCRMTPTGLGDGGVPSTCVNGELDGDETQVDCGGSCPARCPVVYDCGAQVDIPLQECQALKALYEYTDGGGWSVNARWLDPAPCGWLGIVCTSGHVANIQLTDKGLSGGLPPELANLTDLRLLELYGNELTGVLPAWLGDLDNLLALRLSRNQFEGTIPSELGNLGGLQHLSLSENQLTGSIPPELGNLTGLLSLGLDRNQLSGDIPPALGNLTRLTRIWLYSNELSGSIPVELGDLVNATIFDLSANRLMGVVPPELMSVPGDTRFWLHGNGCLTASGDPFIAWLQSKDPLWNDGC